MNNDDNPCWGCKERTEFCHRTCKKGKVAAIKRELLRRKKNKYWREHKHFLTEGERKRAIANLKWKGIQGRKKKDQ